jgi:hypothetical protein
MLDYLGYAAGEILAYVVAFRSEAGPDPDGGPEAEVDALVPPSGDPPALDAHATAEADADVLDLTMDPPPTHRRHG